MVVLGSQRHAALALKAVEVAADHRAETPQRGVPSQEHGQDLTRRLRIGAKVQVTAAGKHRREVHVLQEVLHIAGPARAPVHAVLPGAQSAQAARVAGEGHVLHAEGEGPRRAEDMPAWANLGVVLVDRVVPISDAQAVADVVGLAVRKVLRGLPVHAVTVVDACVAAVLHIPKRILSNKHVVVVKLVLNDVGWPHSVVATVGREFITA
mmetsp:Transcript_46882/g.139964  ORF Transcript_46882/g.139964 Transcript_46882/m.139964 type:complete len:209 (-) Transcript_46882:631-1257(-)